MLTVMLEKKKVRYIASEDIASDLGILDADLWRILKPLSPSIQRDHRGRVAVPATYVQKISSSDEYPGALARARLAESQVKSEDRKWVDSVLRQRRAELLNQYAPWISELEAIHRRYLAAANGACAESSAMASYLLLSRAISTLKALHACLEKGHWYSGSLLRDIDESLDLAHYFAITSGTEQGERVRHMWFRENFAPSHAECRAVISKWHASTVEGEDASDHLDLMRELYRKKSKWTHPTYASIREITEYSPDAYLQVAAIDYGPCAYERKLYELTEFFRSSIWSTFQILYLCFHYGLKLAADDVVLLNRYDRMFQDYAKGA